MYLHNTLKNYHILDFLRHGSKCLDIMGLDIMGLDIMGLDILGIDIIQRKEQVKKQKGEIVGGKKEEVAL